MADDVLALSSMYLLVVEYREVENNVVILEQDPLIQPTDSPVKECFGGMSVRSIDFSSYEIPWCSMPADTIEAFNQQIKLNKRQVADVAQIIHLNVRTIQKKGKLQTGTFRSIVKKMCAEYPASFLDRSRNGELIFDSADYIITKLNNIDYYQRTRDEKKERYFLLTIVDNLVFFKYLRIFNY
jgi:hypothetical protein